MKKAYLLLFLALVLTLNTLTVTADSPPSVTLYTKTGKKRVMINVDVLDDRDVQKVEIFVDGKLVLRSIRNSDFEWNVEYRNNPLHALASILARLVKSSENEHECRTDFFSLRQFLRGGEGVSIDNFTVILETGTHSIKVVGYDSAGQPSFQTVTVDIQRDYPPSITLTPNTTFIRTNYDTATISATIAASDDLGISDVWVRVNGNYAFHVSPYAPDYYNTVLLQLPVGMNYVKAIVRDTGGENVSTTASVHVKKNNPPTISSPASVTTEVGYPATFTVSASDPDSDPITVTYSPPLQGAIFNGETFWWNPSEVGTYTVTFTATDDMGLSATTTTTINVVAPLEIISVAVPDVQWSKNVENVSSVDVPS